MCAWVARVGGGCGKGYFGNDLSAHRNQREYYTYIYIYMEDVILWIGPETRLGWRNIRSDELSKRLAPPGTTRYIHPVIIYNMYRSRLAKRISGRALRSNEYWIVFVFRGVVGWKRTRPLRRIGAVFISFRAGTHDSQSVLIIISRLIGFACMLYYLHLALSSCYDFINF